MTAKVKTERLLKIPHVARHGAARLWLREVFEGRFFYGLKAREVCYGKKKYAQYYKKY